MQQEQEQTQEQDESASRARSRQRSRQTPGWRVFWSLWWIAGVLPWIVIFWWNSMSSGLFIGLFDLIVLLGYIVVPIVMKHRYGRLARGWYIFAGLWWWLWLFSPAFFIFSLRLLHPVAFIALADLLVLFVYAIGLGYQSRQQNAARAPLKQSQPLSTYEQGYQEQTTRDSGDLSVELPRSTSAPSQWDDEQPQASYEG